MKCHILGLCLLLLSDPVPQATRTPDPVPVLYFNTRNIDIAVEHLIAGAAPVDHYELWYTLDDGTTWKMEDDPYPGKSPLRYTAMCDGRFGFRVIAVDDAGKKDVPPQAGAAPDVICVIDTVAPRLEMLSPRGGEPVHAGSPIVFEWQLSDENLADEAPAIEYRRTPADPWEMVRADELFGAPGKQQWYPPYVDGSLEMRVRVLDRAANEREWTTEAPITFLPYTGFRGSRGIATDPYTSFRRFPVFYQLTQLTNVELAHVEIWVRSEADEWQAKNDPDRKSPYILEVAEDGGYFLYLRMLRHNGTADRPPPGPDTPGDARVIVDTLSPQGDLSLGGSSADCYHRAGEPVRLSWHLEDANLEPAGCALELSLDDGATWNRLASQLAMTGGDGSFDWKPPLIEAEAMRFRLVARDCAENLTHIAAPARLFLIDPKADGATASRNHHRAALMLVERGDRASLARALERFELAINYSPANAAAWHDRGVVNTLIGDHIEALRDYRKAHEIAPGDIGFTFSVVKGLLNLHHETGSATSEHLDAARALFGTISKIEVYKHEDYQNLLSSYRVLKSALGDDQE